MKTLFLEEQRFRQWWLWMLIMGITLIQLYGIYQQYIKGETFGVQPMSNSGLVIFLLITIFLLFFLWTLKLTTKIDSEGIVMHFFPFTRKNIRWEDVKIAEVLNYGFVGGWGIRIGTKYGTVYNVSGNVGLALELKDGKKLCIGTQREDEMKLVVNQLS